MVAFQGGSVLGHIISIGVVACAYRILVGVRRAGEFRRTPIDIYVRLPPCSRFVTLCGDRSGSDPCSRPRSSSRTAATYHISGRCPGSSLGFICADPLLGTGSAGSAEIVGTKRNMTNC
jgi:hypothetical protein